MNGPFEATHYTIDGDRIRIYGLNGYYLLHERGEADRLLETLQAAIANRDQASDENGNTVDAPTPLERLDNLEERIERAENRYTYDHARLEGTIDRLIALEKKL